MFSRAFFISYILKRSDVKRVPVVKQQKNSPREQRDLDLDANEGRSLSEISRN